MQPRAYFLSLELSHWQICLCFPTLKVLRRLDVMDAQVAVWHPARVLAMEDAKAHASMSALADVKQGAEIHAKIHATVHLINYA